MKKFFQRIDQSKGDSTHSHTHSSSFVGKTFVIGKYTVTVEDVIAEGGFAIVFLVKGNGGIRYALKRMFVNNEQDLQVSLNEISISKMLNGPRTLVGYIDSSVVHNSNGVYEVLLLLTYCKRHLLHLMNDRINSGFIEAEILKIFCDVCDAVSKLHHSNPPIIHRDLKVENILINSDNGYLLCDFGSATQQVLRGSVDGISNVEDEIQRYTTLAYRAPEMVDLYLDKPITHKSDIWSLGCLLYKLCFFTLPFGESPLAITSGNFTIPENTKYSKYLLDLIRYMLEPDPNQRPDIYQVSCVAFQLANMECPVPNPNTSSTPLLEQLSQIMKEREQQISIKPSRLPAAPVIESTSVAPRQRPKGSQPPSTIGAPGVRVLPLPIQNTPAKRTAVMVSPDVTSNQEDQQEYMQIQQVSVLANEQAGVAASNQLSEASELHSSAFPPSDLFGLNSFSIQPFGSPDPVASQPVNQSGLETEAQKLFPPAGYGDPFHEEMIPPNDDGQSLNPEFDLSPIKRSVSRNCDASMLIKNSLPHQPLANLRDSSVNLPIGHGLHISEQNRHLTSPVLAASNPGSVQVEQRTTPQFNNPMQLPSSSQALSSTENTFLAVSPPPSHTFKLLHRRNVSDSSAFNKVFANETAQFIAPFESSSVKRLDDTHELKQESCSESHLNQREDSGNIGEDLSSWNPFDDFQPFSQMSEDHIFGAAFDKIRQGSQSGSDNSIKVCKEDDPFGAAPFNYGGRRSKASVKSIDHLIRSDDCNIKNVTSPTPPPFTGDTVCGGPLADDQIELNHNGSDGEILRLEYVRPPLEDRSKYEKLQDILDEESDDEKNDNSFKKPHPIKYLQKRRSSKKGSIDSESKLQVTSNSSSDVTSQGVYQMSLIQNQLPEVLTSCSNLINKNSTDSYLMSNTIPPPNLSCLDQELSHGKTEGIFECNVSEDDSIGSATDLQDRINEECDYYYCDRGDASETISSSVYHAECESVTTHEDEGKVDVDVKPDIFDGVSKLKPLKGPRPSRAVLRAKAKALKELENRKSSEDRLLGHEFGEKPLLQDDELDSGEEEKIPEILKNNSSEALGSTYLLSKPFRKLSADDTRQADSQDDVFSLAPFKKKTFKSINKYSFQSRSHPSVKPVSHLDGTGIVSPPAGFKSPGDCFTTTSEVKLPLPVVGETSRIPVHSDIIYEESPSEEFPIYENVILNEGKPLSSDIIKSEDATQEFTALMTKNPFLNPFLNEESVSAAVYASEGDLSVGNSRDFVTSVIMTQSLPESITSSLINVTDLESCSTVPSNTTDMFGSTPFSNVSRSSNMSCNHYVENREPMPDLLSSTDAAQHMKGFKVRNLFLSSESKYIPLQSSTPNKLMKPPPSGGLDRSPQSSKSLENTAEDLFGSVPFKPSVGNPQRSLSSSKSQTLPANMSLMLQNQMAQIAKEDDHIFKVPKNTPPGFRKPRLAHQVLSESGSSSSEDDSIVSSRKSKSRDRSKDRLKYKNIGDEYEEESLMVLPTKQFTISKKEKITKKSKKLDKLDKLDKRYDKQDKAEKKVDKLKEKGDKRPESAGISNMSFEDFSIDENRRNQREAIALQSPEEDDSDLRMTGGTRFGSLKRGMNPFSKLGR